MLFSQLSIPKEFCIIPPESLLLHSLLVKRAYSSVGYLPAVAQAKATAGREQQTPPIAIGAVGASPECILQVNKSGPIAQLVRATDS